MKNDTSEEHVEMKRTTIGFIGLGKLGACIATAIAYRGFNVIGYDINPSVMVKEPRFYTESGPGGHGDFNDYWMHAKQLTFVPTMEELVQQQTDIIFIAVQTPHGPDYEGITYAPEQRADFDYTYLINTIKELGTYLTQPTVVALISTVLPGTIETYIKPIMTEHMKLVYTPQTPAMGTAMFDFLNPEFYILGVDDEEAASILTEFYHTIFSCAPVCRMSLASAELCKVVYNTFITMKISYAEALMEIAEKMNTQEGERSLINVDDITRTLSLATNRLLSPKYLTAGMHDAGSCHPRDLIALSYLSEQLDLSYDLFGEFVRCRENQMGWVASLCATEFDIGERHALRHNERFEESIIILGITFKKESNITTGSSALLVKHILETWGYHVRTYDPYCDANEKELFTMCAPGIVLIGMNHTEFLSYTFPAGTVIIDPFRMIADQTGIDVLRIGEGKHVRSRQLG